ncbi:hypothetical protein QBC35DRAFT_387461 [Podospora australis]|uniref:Uncharacterized protein n=1 Tax=Podospora australis TaxID=1536484 RepID=A0AAN6WQQ9_9PEZI|nr:hypothetical protein QBC35DRAFT_387461 [Podospora australis]
MCDFIQREDSCGHFRFIASKWCKDYTISQRRCEPNMAHFESVEALCGDCRHKVAPKCPWEGMINRHVSH